ncbi:LysR substrate-binding domain-containing protein [Noviherbaspirillum suwonense]|uniref:Transcriptional regulator, LysR family n=1 Tax=Noviherbaspirillum suwonense TaxID=1224511 RepID=A0ABY1QQX4_9BURK|nr:LysR substrate-binding domain-containing protein [Noviherbaspirillum suwonense]SMP75200.1 transcriptional regulator, LysR family [Noviherbaspirillum suwonense]
MKNLPPLRSLVAFDAAARHLSFAKAAQELYVTPGAVGQLIHKLEDWLGLKLFHRDVRKVRLTDAGALYFGRINGALGQISDASLALRKRQRDEVRISMPPSFARKWFVPRMVRFMDLHPGISISIDASAAVVDFDKESVDVAIRHFTPVASDRLDIELLFLEELRVYCSPAYRTRLALQQPNDLARTTLLATRIHPYWDQWFRQFTTLPERGTGGIPAIHFDASHLAIDTAKCEQGVVLTSASLVEQEIANGELIELFEARLSVTEGYYLVAPKGAFAQGGAVDALRRWIRQECAPS